MAFKCDHYISIEKKDEFNKAVLDWLDETNRALLN